MGRTITIAISTRSIIVAVALVAGLYAFSLIPGILILGAISLIVAAAMRPGVVRLEGRGLPRWAAISAMFAAVLGALGLLAAMVLPSLLEQAAVLTRELPRYGQRVEASYAWVQAFQQRFPFLPGIDEVAAQATALASGWLASSFGWASTAFSAILDLTIVVILAFLILLDGPKLERGLLSLAPPAHRALLAAQVEPVARKLGAYVNGILISMAFLAAFLAVGLSVAGVPLALALAILAGVLEIVPIVGPMLAVVPAVLLALAVSWQLALATIAIFLAAQFIQGNFVIPLVFAHSVEISPVLVTVALLIGAELWGIPGAIIAVPLAAAIQVLVQNLYVEPMEARAVVTSTPLMAEPGAHLGVGPGEGPGRPV